MNIVGIEKIYAELKVPKHIILHMEEVANVCRKIVEKFKKKNINIDENIIINAALLHDCMRLKELEGKSHSREMAKYLENRGEKKLATLIKKHDFFSVDEQKTWEEKIFFYADKRVDHNKIVPLKTRFREGKKRNIGNNENKQRVAETEKKIFKLEKEILKKCD